MVNLIGRFNRILPLWPLAILLGLIVVNLFVTPNFGTIELRDGRLYGSLIDIVLNGAPVMLVAAGMTLVIASGGIDLSVGAVMAFAGAVAAMLMVEAGFSAPTAALVAMAVAIVAGLWNGALVTYVGIQPIVATLILLVAGRGLAQWLTDDQKVRFENPAFESIANGSLLAIPVPVLLVVAVYAVLAFVLFRTVVGLYIEAIGSNPRAAFLCGLPIHAVILTAYAVCGACAGLAGLIAAADIKEADVANCGIYVELDAILAVVLGGTSLTGGRPVLLGSLIGAAIMQTLTIMLQMHGVITEHALIVKAAIAVIVVAAQAPRVTNWIQHRIARRQMTS